MYNEIRQDRYYLLSPPNPFLLQFLQILNNIYGLYKKIHTYQVRNLFVEIYFNFPYSSAIISLENMGISENLQWKMIWRSIQLCIWYR